MRKTALALAVALAAALALAAYAVDYATGSEIRVLTQAVTGTTTDADTLRVKGGWSILKVHCTNWSARSVTIEGKMHASDEWAKLGSTSTFSATAFESAAILLTPNSRIRLNVVGGSGTCYLFLGQSEGGRPL